LDGPYIIIANAFLNVYFFAGFTAADAAAFLATGLSDFGFTA
jgi:hypothetical protein